MCTRYVHARVCVHAGAYECDCHSVCSNLEVGEGLVVVRHENIWLYRRNSILSPYTI